MSGKLMKMALAAVLVCMQASVLAEDIDLFAVPPGGSAANVLIVLDNSSNWAANNQGWPTDTTAPVGCGNNCNSKQGYYELKAIRTVISGLPTDASGNVAMNIGLMMFNGPTASRGGGYVRYHVQEMTAANRAAFIAELDQIISNFNTETSSSSVQYGAALFDAFKYFGGHTNPDGVDANPAAPPAPSTNPTYDGIPVFGTEFWGSNTADGTKPDNAAYSGVNYNPVAATACGRNFIVLIGNGFPATDDNSSSNMGEVLRKLTNPSAPATTITEFPLTTVTPNYSVWADVASGSCYDSTALCEAALPASNATTIYQCAKSSCSGNDARVQFATVMSYTSTTAAPSGNATGRFADEFADFLFRTDSNDASGQQEITTYAIDVYRNAPDADQTALLRNVAKYGGGKYFAATNEDALKSAFDDIFSEILSVNSAFASASLPVSVNTQGTYLNQVFIGMFRPEKTPRWFGNLKQYQFRADVDLAGNIVGLTLADKENKAAINSQNGFVSPCAKSFWTPTAADTYWQYGEAGSCTISGSRASNSPDGEVVEKGAAAFKLRGITPADRNVKTCADDSCSGGLVNFDTTDGPSASSLGVLSGQEDNLINWVRGLNVDLELVNDNSTAADMRSSVHGDVVHSRPLAINYGTDAAPKVVVFYGGNDGMLRAINGNRDGGLTIDNVTAMVPGMELWSFVAPEHFDKLRRLRNNTPDVLFTGATYDALNPDPVLKDYYFDGSIGVHRNGGNVWIYPTMRRGGDYVYAFNVSTPTSPSLKWKRGPAELDNVGQTWSEPKVIKVAGYPSAATTTKSPVIIMGGGYDPCEDQDAAPNTLCGASPKGNRVFVLDADTGAVLQTLGTGIGDGDAILRSIAADITVVDSDGDSYVDAAYAVDTGANVYRIDMGSNTPEDTAAGWTIKRIASLGCSSSASCSRKFLHAPEVVVGASSNTVLVGSGNRERPLLVNAAITVDNAFFMITDDRSAEQALITTANLVSVNPDTGVGTDPVSTPNKGWQLVFGSGTHDQEQVVTSAVVVAGVAYFSTHTPPLPSSCDLGKARGYGVNFLDGSSPDGGPLFNVFAGGGLPPSPVAGVVSLTLSNEDGTAKTDAAGNPVTANVPFIIGGGGVSGIDPTLVEVNPSGVRGRVYWYLEQ